MDRLQKRLEDGRQNYEEALQIDRQLAAEDPAKYLPNTAMTLNEFGLLDEAQHRMQDAEQHYEEALNIEQELVKQSPDVYLPQLAMTLENFGMLDAIHGKMQDAPGTLKKRRRFNVNWRNGMPPCICLIWP